LGFALLVRAAGERQSFNYSANSIVNSMREKVPRRNAKWGARSSTTLTNPVRSVAIRSVRFDTAARAWFRDNVTAIILWLNFTTRSASAEGRMSNNFAIVIALVLRGRLPSGRWKVWERDGSPGRSRDSDSIGVATQPGQTQMLERACSTTRAEQRRINSRPILVWGDVDGQIQ